MKIIVTIAAIFGFFQFTFAQGEGIYPLASNADLVKPIQIKSGPETFDSTFIYTSDTLEITLTKSILDDFTKDHFQKYITNYTNPSVTFDKHYKLLDRNTNLPLPLNTKYSNIPTFRRIVSQASGTSVNEPLPSDTIKITSFLVYPPVYDETTVYPPYIIYDTLDFPNDPDTVWQIPPFFVQDSATQFFANIQDQNAYWLDNFAYHNYRFAKNPWTLGVVTFDGLDENGYPYNFGTSTVGLGDVLHSKPIDMTAVSNANEVYFSFLYQTEGLGDIPEETDSLVLEFYAPTVNQWFRAWSTTGAPVADFKKAHIRIQDAKYFQNGFQFRFKSYSGLSGSLDHFHIDYVHLRALSGAQDTLFKDFAFVYPLGSFLKDYTSVPWDHYKNNFADKMTDSARIFVRNGSNIPENSQIGEAWVQYGGTTEGSFPLSTLVLTNQDPVQNYQPRTFYESFHDFTAGYHFDETKAGDYQIFDLHAAATSPFAQITLNDSTVGKQVFANYYAYDDGSAEQAYGTTGNQSRLAYQFTPYEADSLIGVQMHFVPSVQDVSGNLFLLTVWDDNNGKPGNVIYEDDFFFPRQPKYENERNKFTNYYLKDTAKLAITGTFYVGWRQLEADKLCIGFDRNTINSNKIFYSVDNGTTWPNTSFEGSVMIRPIFSTAMDASLGIKETFIAKTLFEVYPNPVNNTLYLKVDNNQYKGAVIFDLQGKLMFELDESNTEINLESLTNGVYFVKDIQSGITRKIIKN